MSALKRKRRTMEIQDDPSAALKRKRDLNSNAEEMDASQASDSTVLFELDISNSMNIPGDKNPIKVERSQDDAAYISYNNADENQLDIKDPNLSIRSVLNASRFSARGTPGNTSVIKMERNEEESAHNSSNAVEEAQHHNSRNNAVEEAHNSCNNDGEAHNSHINGGEAHNSRNNDEETEKQLDIVDVSVNDVSVLNETVAEAQPKKKKKKKKKHLDESELENNVIADNVQDNVEEIQQEQIEDVESSPKKKKKKKKKHRDEESQAEEQEHQTNEETEDTPRKKRKKRKENDVSQLEIEAEETEDISPKKRKKKKEKENELENEAVVTGKKRKNKKDNDFTKSQLEADGELSISDIKRMFEDIHEKIAKQKAYHVKKFWDNYEFPPFSRDQCKIAYEKIMSKVQKKRTIIELISAAEKMLWNNPAIFLGENKNVKPITPLKIYVNEHFQKVADKYPDQRPIEKLNKLAKRWCKLSDRKKLKYFDLALIERPKYLATLEICRKVEPLLISKPTLSKSEWLLKDKLAGLPDPPLRNGFGYFLQSGYSLYPDMPYTKKLKLLAADYKVLPNEVKEKYHEQHLEVKNQYRESLENYLLTLTPIEREDREHHTLNKEQKLIKKRTASNQRNKPPASGYALFFRELREENAGDYSGIIKQMQVSEKWRALKEEQRVEYNRRRLVIYSEWLANLKEKENEEAQNESPQNENPETEKTSSNDA